MQWDDRLRNQAEVGHPYGTYSASSLIRTSIIRILAYPNSQKQDYNIIHKHLCNIFFYAFHISEFFNYPNKNIFSLHKGVRISEDALYIMPLTKFQ